jgi:hypothetical protein
VRTDRSIWFLAWMGVGVAYAIGVLGALSLGIVALGLAVLATFLLGSRPEARSGFAGIISGIGVGLLYVAYLNRAGPGIVCTTTATGDSSCVERWNPWPWVVIGVGLLAGGWFWSRASRRH